MWDWELIIDKSHEQCTSWQTLYFEKRPVVFIRITGTQNTANEVSIGSELVEFLYPKGSLVLETFASRILPGPDP